MNPNSSAEQTIRRYLINSAETKRKVAEECVESIVAAANLLAETFRSGGKVLLCGNGGSAADCQHIATEFVSRLNKDFQRPGMPAIALTTDTSFITAFSNDVEFEGIFERQVEVLGRSGDALLGISTSGNSVNVVRAVKAASSASVRTVVLTGNGGRLAEMADVAIQVPSADTQHIQESHLAVEHIICYLVERAVYSGGQLAVEHSEGSHL